MNDIDRILITGHNGFVGRALIKRFKDLGFLNILTGDRHKYDLLNKSSVVSLLSELQPNIVIHTAAVVGGIQANINDPYKFLFDNLMIQNNIIDASKKSKSVEQFINLGSSCIYPKDYIQPLKEEYLLKDIPEPTNEGYSLAKICGLKLCEYANRDYKEHRTIFKSLMPCNLYGPGDNFDPINSHVLSATIRKVYEAKQKNEPIKIWGTGEPCREFLYIDDLVDCIIWSIDNLNYHTVIKNPYLNVGTGTDISVLNLTKKVCDILDYHPEFIFDKSKPDGMLHKLLDVSKINELGWKSKIDLDTGLINTISYYEKIFGDSL